MGSAPTSHFSTTKTMSFLPRSLGRGIITIGLDFANLSPSLPLTLSSRNFGTQSSVCNLLCSLPFALCPLPFALRSSLSLSPSHPETSGLSPQSAIFCVLCPLPFALRSSLFALPLTLSSRNFGTQSAVFSLRSSSRNFGTQSSVCNLLCSLPFALCPSLFALRSHLSPLTSQLMDFRLSDFRLSDYPTFGLSTHHFLSI